MKQLTKYMVYSCMAVFTMLALSCERDTWLTGYESKGSGEPVNVLLSFEVPQADEVTVTRTMSELEEHNIRDLYVLIFDAVDGSLVSRQYFDENALNVTKVNHANGEWGSVLDANTNSTHGTVMAKALDKSCLVFGIANVNGDDSEISSLKTPAEKTLLTISNLNEFYQLQAFLKEGISLGRVNSHLLMSGAFVLKDKYRPTGYNAYDGKYTKGKAGYVDISQDAIQELKDENGFIDLTQAGVIRLRRLASHISFKIKINQDNVDLNGDGIIEDDEKVFIDFKPESWRVFHVPTKSYLMDMGDEKLKITGNFFSTPDAQRSMIHAEGTYQFDFYMYENHKEARDIHTIGATSPADSLWADMAPANKTFVTWYYQPQFGYSITDIDNSSGSCIKLTSDIYNNDPLTFKYAKRELALKDNDGNYVYNADGTKQFVYVEPNATYVEIKGRLRFNTKYFQLTDIIKRGVDKTTNESIKDGYADVTYIVHLGYARENNLKGERPEGMSADDYKMSDFNSLRNTEYTYNIEVRGVNSIYTQVVTESDDDIDKRESAKVQAGASGFVGMATEDVYNTDAHFNAFNIFLDVTHLDKDKYFFVINTPWSEIDSSGMDDTNYGTSSSKYYKFNSDLTWIKVRRNTDQTFGTNETEYVQYLDADKKQHRATMPYYKAGATDQTDYPLIDLYQLKMELTKLAGAGLPITLKVGTTTKIYTAKLETVTEGTGTVKKLNYYEGTTLVGSLQGLFYTVYLDEYYYQTPPVGTSWSKPYWHEFANKPARYVSFSTTAAGTYASTRDKESSIIKPQLMIVQPSIQTHYATDGGIIVGLGMEHYNETPHPRWKDNGPGGSIGTSFSGNRKKLGWLNAKDYVVDKTAVTWDGYVADYVGLYNNLTMLPNLVNGKVPTVEYKKLTDNDAQYKAGAIRLCMNRNRDENGNGKIDENELKWYLPASSQLDIISMCHYSFYDPLLNYNDYIIGTDDNGNAIYRLKNYEGTYADKTGSGDMYGGNFYQFHYIVSDYMKLTSEEMMNLNPYTRSGVFLYNPGEMRCVRNLGEADGDTHANKSVLKPYFSYNADGTVAKDITRYETQTYTGSEPNVMFEFRKKEVQRNGKWVFTDKIFVMEKYLDSRSIRTAKYVNEELPPHYLFSETDRPYKAFKVAENEVYMTFDKWKKKFGDATYIQLEDIYRERPCGEYWEETDEDGKHPDLGSWRAPSAAELSMMIHYLRVNDDGGYANESTTPALFFAERSPYPYSATSWNFAGKMYVRMVAISSNTGDNKNPRKLWMSDGFKFDGSSNPSSSFKFGEAKMALANSTVPLRCVKDIEPPLD